MGLKFRRGTTAQKSGSLAFGEPYVNTDLNTLQIGGATGDIILAAAGTSSVFVGQSVSASNWISASSLDVSGNAKIGGDLTINGKIQIGDNTSDTVNVVASLSSSLIPEASNIYNLGSPTKFWKEIYVSTGSINFVDNSGNIVSTLSSNADGNFNINGEFSASAITGIGNVTTYSQSVDSRLDAVELFSASLDSTFATDAQLTSVSGALATSISASKAEYTAFSASNATTDNTQTANITTAQNSANGAFASASAYSSSAAVVAQTNSNAAAGAFASASAYSASAASALNTLSSSIATTDSTLTTNINAASASAAGAFASASAYSASAYTKYAQLNTANVFTGTQTITGSLYVSQNLIVQGSSSLQNITASAVSIGTNTVILNTDAPSVRFGGIKVIDSGSSASTGSLLWDSENNVWIYANPDGANYTSARLIAGPKNSGSLGSETGLTVGQVPVAIGDDHIGDSIISASATKITIAGGLDVTGNISASTLNGVGNVTAYSTSVASRLNTVETAGYAVSSSVATATANSISTLSGSIYTTTNTVIGNVTTAQNSANGAFASASAYSASLTTTDITNANAAAGAFASASAYSASIYTRDAGQDANITTAQNSANGAFASASAYSASIAANTVTFNGSAVKLGGSATITANTTNALTIGTGLSGTSFNGSAAITIANTGVTSITGTTNQVVASASTGGVTLSLPQSIATTSAVAFASVSATGDIVAYSGSDKRLKNNIINITDALIKVRKLNGVTWKWNDDVNEVTKTAPTTGLIAQEVQEVLPEVVNEREDGFLGIDYSKMVGLLVEAIKEQQQQIDSLTIELEKLKKDNSL